MNGLRMIEGRVWKFGDSIDTDVILPSRYMLLPTVEEMKAHAMEPIMPQFAGAFQPGNIIVAGRNFGCGSSREQAPAVLQALGVGAIVAKSFSRIFFRNAVNLGIPIFTCEEFVAAASDGDQASIDINLGIILLRSNGARYTVVPLPAFIQEIISAGGIIPVTQKKLLERTPPGSETFQAGN